MSKYRVIVVTHQYGEVVVSAKSKKEAEEKVQDQLDAGEAHVFNQNEESEVIEVQSL